MEETGVFWQALPERGLSQKRKQYTGGKKSKRVTVALFVNSAGDKEKPIVIWSSENPPCWRRFDMTMLPVHYFSHKKSWMNSEIMTTVLGKLNRCMSSSKRSIILFMDNAGCHLEDLAGKFCNIKIVFLPANTTSELQPLDVGILKKFKVHYRRYLLQYVLSKIDEPEKATDVIKSVNILVAIRWIAKACQTVTEETIKKCFRKAGVLTSTMNVVSTQLTMDSDPFLECDDTVALQGLIEMVMPHDNQCSVVEYIQGENDVQVC